LSTRSFLPAALYEEWASKFGGVWVTKHSGVLVCNLKLEKLMLTGSM